ncbi:N,N-dimethylformamidase beta subunit family domain-containing protein [Chromobacterium sp. IIBBL 290-4]|uniref:N,N-dimethylformamidase beta subunit family domain-containing protein n=1 Tax=Chromobacterium sp. IIBBL 290-4 TaxID=2953890 RepID=UPI0020B7E537|nr:N,N-dimethylformamidase beta subunit family domain-containing protein [Chromobacterium sp. IIBBL 290-4]UTH73784.1 hypothetical protein NKT35_19910 [Chromobacterium sp. IIBBL 290-4]
MKNYNRRTVLSGMIAAALGAKTSLAVANTASRSLQLEMYTDASSVEQGETLTFFVRASYAVAVKLDLYLIGSAETHVASFHLNAEAQATRARPYRYGAAWSPSAAISTSAYAPGLYMAKVHADPLHRASAYVSYFLIRPREPGALSKILFLWPFATSEAYNNWGGRCLYSDISRDGLASPVISNQRPNPTLAADVASNLPLLQFTLKHGLPVEHCSSYDLHFNPALLSHYRLLVIFGHDEYWSWEMRQAVEAFKQAGGNIANFSGNTCWWQARFAKTGQGLQMTCYRTVAGIDTKSYPNEDNYAQDPIYNDGSGRNHLASIEWYRVPVSGSAAAATYKESRDNNLPTSGDQAFYPENIMLGVSFRCGFIAGANKTLPKPLPYSLADGAFRHWIFANCELPDGATFGELARVIENECEVDGGRPGQGGSPRNFQVLANCPSTDNSHHEGGWFSEATMGIMVGKGSVFSASTNHWARNFQREATTRHITLNVMRRLSAQRRIHSLTSLGNAVIALFSDGGAMITRRPAALASQDARIWYDGAKPMLSALSAPHGVYTELAGGRIYFTPASAIAAQLSAVSGPAAPLDFWDSELVYADGRPVLAWASWADGVLTAFSDDRVCWSPDGLNLGGGGNTIAVDAGPSPIKHIWIAAGAIYIACADHSCYRATDPANLRQTLVYQGKVPILNIVGWSHGAVCVHFADGRIAYSPDGVRLDAGRLLADSLALKPLAISASPTGLRVCFDGLVTDSPDLKNLGGGGSTRVLYQGNTSAASIQALHGGLLTLFSDGRAYWSPDGLHLGGGGNSVLAYLPK